ncbi:MAG: hypothetical protein ACOYN2_03315 [Patescibacteria group bacterium]
MTKETQDELDSKNFEGMIYAQYEPKIADIIEQEIGFRPDLRARSLQRFEGFKRRQKMAMALSVSGKEKDEKGRTVADHLEVMRMEAGDLVTQYTGDAWDKWTESLAKQNNMPMEKIGRLTAPFLIRIRDRLASEIPVLDE